MKIIRESAQQQLVQSIDRLALDKTSCLFFIIGMILAAFFMQYLFT
ncbi:hypothetical protein [Alkanindiges hydrocarboniclasticus]|jgi:hypothetical protein|nr:hypothetical protein [Alkanindiges hydrocarboniclasticus]